MLIDSKERERRRTLVHRHMAAENAHDLTAIMDTFSLTTTGEINGVLLPTFESVRALHVLGGFSSTPGALRGLQVVPESESFTRDEIVIEGCLVGQHVGEFLGLISLSISMDATVRSQDLIDGTAKFAGTGKIFGSNSPLLTGGDLSVEQTLNPTPFVAEHFTSDLSCAELSKKL